MGEGWLIGRNLVPCLLVTFDMTVSMVRWLYLLIITSFHHQVFLFRFVQVNKVFRASRNKKIQPAYPLTRWIAIAQKFHCGRVGESEVNKLLEVNPLHTQPPHVHNGHACYNPAIRWQVIRCHVGPCKQKSQPERSRGRGSERVQYCASHIFGGCGKLRWSVTHQ
jgi:hypothetical protein